MLPLPITELPVPVKVLPLHIKVLPAPCQSASTSLKVLLLPVKVLPAPVNVLAVIPPFVVTQFDLRFLPGPAEASV